MRFVGILNDKIFDICSDLINKRTRDNGVEISKEELDTIVYLETEESDLMIKDTWIDNKSLKDSPQRFEMPEKSEFELLKEKVVELEERIKVLETKITASKT